MVRSVLGLGALFGCILLCAGIIAPRAAYPADIEIAGATAASGGARALTLVVDGPTFTWPIVVRRNDSGEKPVSVRVDITSLVGPSAQSAEPLQLSLNGQRVETAEFELSALRQQEVRLAGTLPVEGDFTGQLGVIVDGKRASYDLKVQRRKPPNPPKARFVGATSDNKLAMTSDRSTFDWPLIIRRDDTSKQQEVDVTLSASPMSGPSGTIIQPRLLKDGKPLSTIRLGAVPQSLTLSGTADREGPYTGEISYDIDGTVASLMLTLTRQHPDLDFKIEPISKIHATAGDAVTLQLRLLNTSSATRELYLPGIMKLERTDILGSGPVQVGPGDYKVDFRRDDGKPLQPLTVDGNRDLTLAATITGLTLPGAYKGVVRFTAPDRKPADTAFELSLRLPVQWPAGAIALGVIVAAFLRYYQGTGQPRLLLQRNALTLRSNVTMLLQTESRDLNDRERHVFKTLIEQIDEASDRLADPDAPIETTSASIAMVRRKSSLLTPWITARRRQDTLAPEVAAAIEPDLKRAFDTLMKVDASDNEITTAASGLDGIEAKITAELTKSFTEAVTRLTRAIEDFDPADQPRFDPVTASLAAVTAQTGQSRFKEAADALAEARSRFVEIAADLLRTTLAAAPTAIGFVAADWTAFVAEITGLLDEVATEPDSEKRVQRWTAVNRRYLVRVVQRARARIDELVEADIAGTQDALKRAQAKLVEAQAALARGETGAARTHYQVAIQAAGSVRPTLRAQGQQLGKVGGADAAAPGSGADLPTSIFIQAIAAVWPLPLGRNVTLAQATKRLRSYSIRFGAVMLAIAVVSGVQLLYVANPAFGYVDVIVCFLWGAGLQAVAGQTFQGLTGLAQQLR